MARTWAGSSVAWENLPRAFTFFSFARFLGNTLVVAIGGTLLHLATSCLAGTRLLDCASAAETRSSCSTWAR
jgi:ABC-type glycerol-3-phosphate transport system permease component